MGRRKTVKEKLLDLLYDFFIQVYSLFLLIAGIAALFATGNIYCPAIVMAVGVLVFFIIKWLIGKKIEKARQKRILESGIDIVDEMRGEAFEEFLLVHFKSQGYEGYMTPRTDDYGADLVLEKDGRRIVVQAKRWKNVVGIEAVQQVVSAVKHYDAHKGMVITNSNFTENAYKLANSNGIELWDRQKLFEFMKKYKERAIAKGVAQSAAERDVISGIRG